jgi:hypothetical protein
MNLLTPADLAATLRVSERTIARMTADGCPSLLVRARRRYDLTQVTVWITERAYQCPSVKTPPATGTPRPASAVDAFTGAYRRAALRVMPSSS